MPDDHYHALDGQAMRLKLFSGENNFTELMIDSDDVFSIINNVAGKDLYFGTTTTGILQFDGPASISQLFEMGAITATGIIDFGGATSWEMPNGANGTVDADGEITLDTTADQIVYFSKTEHVLTASKSYPFGISSPSAGLLVDGPTLPYDFTIATASCDSGNEAGEIVIISGIYECLRGVCGEHINTTSVSCDFDGTSFLLNDYAGAKGAKYRLNIASTNDSCETDDQVIVNLWGEATRK